MVSDHQLLRLDVATAFKLMKQLRADCHLLVSCHCMDYSLLLGVHKTSLPQDSLTQDGGFVSFNQVEGTAVISVPESEENAYVAPFPHCIIVTLRPGTMRWALTAAHTTRFTTWA